MTDIDKGWQHFKKFVRLCRNQFVEFDYVAVPERQIRGAIHFHVALRGFYNVNVLRHLWHKATGCDRGDCNVDITRPRKGGQWERARIVRYLAKYLGKNLNMERMDARRYSASGSIPPPGRKTFYVAVGDDTFIRLWRLTEAISGRKVRQHWETDIAGYELLFFSTA